MGGTEDFGDSANLCGQIGWPWCVAGGAGGFVGCDVECALLLRLGGGLGGGGLVIGAQPADGAGFFFCCAGAIKRDLARQ